jgi:precorrin-3B synthase
MLSGDGYIFRLRLTNGVLSFARAKAFAALARRYGNGAFDLSARANLQMRGVGAAHIAPLQEALATLGLLDSDPRAEAVRNIVPSPLAGFDPSALLDTRPLVVALEALLTREKALHDLPPKFGFSIDGGGALSLIGLSTDIDFAAVTSHDRPRLRVSLGGTPAGDIAPDQICATAAILARNFLRLRGDHRRMSALVARIGVGPLLEGAPIAMARDAEGAFGANGKILGAQNVGAYSFVGAGLLFGRIEADELEGLAQAAQDGGAVELRLTPWRALLAVGLSRQGAEKFVSNLKGLGFLLNDDDPRLAFSACPGAPACSSALADVRALSLALAPHWRADAGRVHVSGCAKGCAYHGHALTFVAERDGFSLVESGFARDEPSARGLDLAGCEKKLMQISMGARV